MTITNFTFEKFIQQDRELIENYVTALRFVPPAKTKRQVMNMKLKHVEMIKDTINSGNDADLIHIMSKVQKCTKEEVLQLKIIDFFKVLNSIREQVNVIIRAEESLTPKYIDPKWQMVNGGERMAKFGIYNTLDNLSGGDILKYKEIMNMNYSEVFTVLLMRTTANNISKEISMIKT